MRCDGNDVSLDYATPNDGYVTTVGDHGPAEVQVRFDNGTRRSDIRVVCHDSLPQSQITES